MTPGGSDETLTESKAVVDFAVVVDFVVVVVGNSGVVPNTDDVSASPSRKGSTNFFSFESEIVF